MPGCWIWQRSALGPSIEGRIRFPRKGIPGLTCGPLAEGASRDVWAVREPRWFRVVGGFWVGWKRSPPVFSTGWAR